MGQSKSSWEQHVVRHHHIRMDSVHCGRTVSFDRAKRLKGETTIVPVV
jgi:hypothetical protein